MSFTPRSRLVNPRLGTYYGIFSAGLLALFMLLLIFEQLGVSDALLRLAFVLGPVGLFMAIGALCFTRDPAEFFANGRRVPAVYTGLLLGLTAYGATGIVTLTGVFYVIGYDALFLVIGAVAGFVLMATLLAPYLRKAGTYTLPGFLGRRLHSRGVRLAAAAVVAVPLLLVIAAEIRIGSFLAGWLLGRPAASMAPLLVLVLLVTIAAGGLRSQTWSSVAQAIFVLLALAVPVGIVAVFMTNLPIPQLSHGPVLRALGRNEVAEALPVIVPAPLSLELPGATLAAIAKRFSDPFGSVGALAFTLMTATVMAGIAAAPWLLPRIATTPTIYASRKCLSWATFFFGLVMMTLASVAIFMRDYTMNFTWRSTDGTQPSWMRELIELGYMNVAVFTQRPLMTDFSYHRDAVLFALPMAAELPAVLLHLALAGAIAAALAAAASAVVTLGNLISEDVLNGLVWEPLPDGLRLNLARLAFAAASLVGLFIALSASSDPLMLLLWALALTAGSLFPVLVLAVWWKRFNKWGCLSGLATGFTVTVLGILAGEAEMASVSSALAAVPGLPASFVAAIVVSKLTPIPDRHVLEMSRDIRMPGGETLYDREMRLQRLKQRQRP